jgi:hypothetical protein
VAVAGEQLLHEGQVLARLEEQDQAVVGPGAAQAAPDLLHNPSQSGLPVGNKKPTQKKPQKKPPKKNPLKMGFWGFLGFLGFWDHSS